MGGWPAAYLRIRCRGGLEVEGVSENDNGIEDSVASGHLDLPLASLTLTTDEIRSQRLDLLKQRATDLLRILIVLLLESVGASHTAAIAVQY